MDPRQRLHMMGLLREMAAAGPDHPVLLAHPRGGRAARRRHPGRPRRPAGRVRRLPLDPPPDDRPAAHVHGPLLGRPPARGGAARPSPSVFGVELVDGLLSIRTADYGAFTRALPRVARDAGITLYEVGPDRRVARERVRLPGAPMTAFSALVGVTLRGLLSRRRIILMTLLAGIPVLLGAVRLPARRPPGRRPGARHPHRPDRDAAGRAGARHGRARVGDRGRDRRLPARQAGPALAGRAGEDRSSRSC